MNRFLAIIPARYGSTRFPGKPLAQIHNKPMIQHVFERAKAFFQYVFVATDDSRIAEAVQKFNGKYVMTSENHQSGTDRCAEAYQKITRQNNLSFDVVVNIQGDEPFIDVKQFSLLCGCFDDASVQISTLIKQIHQLSDLVDTNKPKVVLNKDNEAIYFSRAAIPYFRGIDESAWLENHAYFKHIGLYAYRTDILEQITQLAKGKLELAESLEQLRWLEYGYRIATRITDIDNRSVDTPEDLVKIESLF